MSPCQTAARPVRSHGSWAGSMLIPPRGRDPYACIRCAALIAATASLLCGCATPRLDAARNAYYAGAPARAAELLQEESCPGRDRILFLMERGMIRQAAMDYNGSIKDWRRGADEAGELDMLSLSEGAASILSNDRIRTFTGAPYERTLLHAFAAKSYMALEMWEDAAVEARNIVYRLENREGFPDDPYSRFLAGFCFEMLGDDSNASVQYRLASELAPSVGIDDRTGAIAGPKCDAGQSDRTNSVACELVCFIAIGRGPAFGAAPPADSVLGAEPSAEIYHAGRYLGRSYCLSTTGRLLAMTEVRTAAMRAAKDTARIVVKDAISDAVSKKDQLLGEFIRLLLFSLEAPDTRRWETVPYWLEVARVPCPEGMKSYTLLIKDGLGRTVARRNISAPLVRRNNTFFSFHREL